VPGTALGPKEDCVSRLHPLIDALRKSDAQEMRLEPGERIYMLKAGRRQDVGREVLQTALVDSLAAEALQARPPGSGSDAVRVYRQGEEFLLEFRRNNGSTAISIRRSAPIPEAPVAAAARVEAGSPATAAPPGLARSTAAGPGARIDELLRFMIASKASDLHLSADCHPGLRVDGEMRFVSEKPALRSQEIEQLVREILTIEDPVEFVHPNIKCLVNQREVGTHTQSFKNALRAALREDPDIVLVGEMRDLETIEIAIETAETGHLVFGTLHTTSAVSTVDPPDRSPRSGSCCPSPSKVSCRRCSARRSAGGGLRPWRSSWERRRSQI
jgi:hypothetical protein